MRAIVSALLTAGVLWTFTTVEASASWTCIARTHYANNNFQSYGTAASKRAAEGDAVKRCMQHGYSKNWNNVKCSIKSCSSN